MKMEETQGRGKEEEEEEGGKGTREREGVEGQRQRRRTKDDILQYILSTTGYFVRLIREKEDVEGEKMREPPSLTYCSRLSDVSSVEFECSGVTRLLLSSSTEGSRVI
jgi:hypothetical protein